MQKHFMALASQIILILLNFNLNLFVIILRSVILVGQNKHCDSHYLLFYSHLQTKQSIDYWRK